MKRRNFIAVAFVVAVLLPGSQALGHPSHKSRAYRASRKNRLEARKAALEAKKSRLERKRARGKKSAQKYTDMLSNVNQRLAKKSGALSRLNTIIADRD